MFSGFAGENPGQRPKVGAKVVFFFVFAIVFLQLLDVDGDGWGIVCGFSYMNFCGRGW